MIAGLTALLTTTLGALIGYGISRMRHWSTDGVLLFFLASMAFPLLMITIYGMLVAAGLLDTYLAVIIGHTVLTLPIVVWLTKGFHRRPAGEGEAVRRRRGGGGLRIVFDVVLPMMRPGAEIYGIGLRASRNSNTAR